MANNQTPLDDLNVLGVGASGESGKSAESLLETLLKRFEDVNAFYITKVAEQILTLGEMNQSSINRITIMAVMNENMASITAQLAKAVRAGVSDVYEIYSQALEDTYTDPRFERALTETPLSDEAKAQLKQYAEAVARQTANTMQNLANTTAVSDSYRQTLDKAILSVTSGLGDYRQAARDAIKELGSSGMKVTYESGYRRRLDTALRQNITNGAKQIAQHSSDIMGEELGFDAVELTAHARSAPDHEPVQGRVFLKEEFEKMQSGEDFVDVDGNYYTGFKRPIGEWNCMHIAMSFSTEHSVRRYANEQLDQWARDNAEGCTINGKHRTIYEASQMMRQLETSIRHEKDIAVIAQKVNDEMLREECQIKINNLSRQYNQVVAASGLKARRDRMTVEGFRRARLTPNT